MDHLLEVDALVEVRHDLLGAGLDTVVNEHTASALHGVQEVGVDDVHPRLAAPPQGASQGDEAFAQVEDPVPVAGELQVHEVGVLHAEVPRCVHHLFDQPLGRLRPPAAAVQGLVAEAAAVGAPLAPFLRIFLPSLRFLFML